MTVNIDFVLLVCSFICFVLGAIGVPTRGVSLVPLGLALWVLSFLI